MIMTSLEISLLILCSALFACVIFILNKSGIGELTKRYPNFSAVLYGLISLSVLYIVGILVKDYLGDLLLFIFFVLLFCWAAGVQVYLVYVSLRDREGYLAAFFGAIFFSIFGGVFFWILLPEDLSLDLVVLTLGYSVFSNALIWGVSAAIFRYFSMRHKKEVPSNLKSIEQFNRE
jgi:hypothetical protein